MLLEGEKASLDQRMADSRTQMEQEQTEIARQETLAEEFARRDLI